ncbi:MAG: hypothetical protein HKN09_12425 [Saprospiraceae bacterium]|nr:hypothetical protein [Saprospiraceae bacterium]
MRRYLIYILLLIMLPICGYAQALVGLEIQPDSISIGEETQFIISIQYPQDFPLRYIDLSAWDSLELMSNPTGESDFKYYADVEWKDQFPEDYRITLKPENIISTNDGYLYKDTFPLRIWDIGVFMPEPIKLYENDTLSITNIKYLQAGIIAVYPPMDIENPDTTKQILPLEDIVLEEDTLEDYIHIIYGLALLFGIVLFVYLYRKFTKAKEASELEQAEKEIIPAHIIALEALDKLESKQLWLNNKEKEHQSELTYILRAYLENQFGIPALESTTDEIKRALNQVNWDVVRINDVNEILQIADLVKFAKAKPDEDIHQAFLDRTRQLVTDTSSELEELNDQKADDDE